MLGCWVAGTHQPSVSISSGQRNLMKTYHIEANTTGGITKNLHRKMFCSFSDKVDTVFPQIRPAGINFLQGLQLRVLLERGY